MVINPGRLQEVAMGDDEFMMELIDLYLQDAPDQLEALGKAVASQDNKAVSAAAHKLKGSCGNVGAEGLVALCQQIEASGKASRIQEVADLFQQVHQEFVEVHRTLRGIKSGAPLTTEKTNPEPA